MTLCHRPPTKALKRYAPFNENEFIQLHSPHVLPFVCLVKLDTKDLSPSIWIISTTATRSSVNATELAKYEGPVRRSVWSGMPQVDNLRTLFEQRRGIGGRRTREKDGVECCLVYMHKRDGPALLGTVIYHPGSAAADC